MIICRCDGCGKEVPAISNGRELIKPQGWLERKNIVQQLGDPLFVHACSKECIDKIEAKLKTGELRDMQVGISNINKKPKN